jgi:hypothetical protein
MTPLRSMHLFCLFAVFTALVPTAFAQQATHYDLRRVGLGTDTTVVVVFSEAAPASVSALPFYQTLAALPGMDGIARRLVVIAPDGVVPAREVLLAHGVKPHRLTSGPSPADLPLPVRGIPAVVVLNTRGVQVGAWEGALTPDQQRDIVRAITGVGTSGGR